jgi:hypothetical protein
MPISAATRTPHNYSNHVQTSPNHFQIPADHL